MVSSKNSVLSTPVFLESFFGLMEAPFLQINTSPRKNLAPVTAAFVKGLASARGGNGRLSLATLDNIVETVKSCRSAVSY
jgi:hypothetical protein